MTTPWDMDGEGHTAWSMPPAVRLWRCPLCGPPYHRRHAARPPPGTGRSRAARRTRGRGHGDGGRTAGNPQDPPDRTRSGRRPDPPPGPYRGCRRTAAVLAHEGTRFGVQRLGAETPPARRSPSVMAEALFDVLLERSLVPFAGPSHPRTARELVCLLRPLSGPIRRRRWPVCFGARPAALGTQSGPPYGYHRGDDCGDGRERHHDSPYALSEAGPSRW